jgi:hypothetical protein
MMDAASATIVVWEVLLGFGKALEASTIYMKTLIDFEVGSY